MKIVFIVHVEYSAARVMEIFKATGIDYYTRWDEAKGKGHGTDPHLGTGGYPSTNSVVMIAFEDEQPLANLIDAITAANTEIKRPADRIRLFQMPLERIV
jgi:hypothetical protein